MINTWRPFINTVLPWKILQYYAVSIFLLIYCGFPTCTSTANSRVNNIPPIYQILSIRTLSSLVCGQYSIWWESTLVLCCESWMRSCALLRELEEKPRSLHWIPFLHRKWFFTSELQSPADWPATPSRGAVWNALVQSALHTETRGQHKPSSRRSPVLRCPNTSHTDFNCEREQRKTAISYNTQHKQDHSAD